MAFCSEVDKERRPSDQEALGGSLTVALPPKSAVAKVIHFVPELSFLKVHSHRLSDFYVASL